jgi:hypothetical protein
MPATQSIASDFSTLPALTVQQPGQTLAYKPKHLPWTAATISRIPWSQYLTITHHKSLASHPTSLQSKTYS